MGGLLQAGSVLLRLESRGFNVSQDQFLWVTFGTLAFFGIILWLVYLHYKYERAHNPQRFKQRLLFAPGLWILALTALSVLVVNLFAQEPPRPAETALRPDSPTPAIAPARFADITEITAAADSAFFDPARHVQVVERHFRMPEHAFLPDSSYFVRQDEMLLIYYRYSAEETTDAPTRDIGNFGTALYYYHLHQPQKALDYLQQVKARNLPALHYARARVLLQLERKPEAMAELEAELALSGFRSQECYTHLVPFYVASLNVEKLRPLAYQPQTASLIPQELLREVYFRNADVGKYLGLTLRLSFQHLNVVGFLAALFITVIWLVYLLALDLFRSENVKPVLTVLLLGMVFSFITFLLGDFYTFFTEHRLSDSAWSNLLFFFLKVGVVEETVKLLPLLLLIYFTNIPDEPYDFLLYAGVSALGFAFVENLIYFDGQPGANIHTRTFTSVVGHMILSGIAAYGLVLARYRDHHVSQARYLLVFLGIAALLHGLYDFMLYEGLLPLFFFFFLVVAQVWMILINNALNNSPFFNYRLQPNSARIQFYTLVSLTGVLLAEYITEGFRFGPGMANHDLAHSLYRDASILIFFAFTLNRLDLNKGYWRSISFFHPRFADGDAGSALAPLAANHISPQNYVGCFVSFRPNPKARNLAARLPQALEGRISDRVVLHRADKGTVEQDPYWFLVKLYQPLSVGKATIWQVLLKFREANPSLHDERDVEATLKAVPDQPRVLADLNASRFPFIGRVLVNEIFADDAEVVYSEPAAAAEEPGAAPEEAAAPQKQPVYGLIRRSFTSRS